LLSYLHCLVFKVRDRHLSATALLDYHAAQ